MARTPKNLNTGTLTDTVLKTIYIVPAGTVTSSELVLTNTTAAKAVVNVFIFDTDADLLLVRIPIPGGIGKRFRVLSMNDVKLNPFFEIKIQLESATPVNFFLSGTEIADS